MRYSKVLIFIYLVIITGCASDPNPCIYSDCHDSVESEADESSSTDSIGGSGGIGNSEIPGPSLSNDRVVSDGSEEGSGKSLSYNKLHGVNLAGAEFGEHSLPGSYQVDYIYPNTQEVDYFIKKGMSIFRIPFRWERLQSTLLGDFNANEQKRLSGLVDYITDKGAWVILDPHNYARYNNSIIGEGVEVEAFADFWRRMALLFVHPQVIYGLINEPHSMQTELWLEDANIAIDAIRQTGAKNLILVPGNAWTGAHSWLQDWYGTPNGEVMLGISDPLNNFAFEVHQYLDEDSSGKAFNCVNQTTSAKRLTDFTNWLRAHEFRGFLGEFAGGKNSTCYQGVEGILSHLEDNQDVWIGWTYWAAGPWWGSYEFSIEPQNGQDEPMMDVLQNFL